ncbi:MAG: hypothetical protein LPL29_03915 [Alphaproteobacteria bacterium]|nr:hypothetical protein [Alphaproteobacteria bacterium]
MSTFSSMRAVVGETLIDGIIYRLRNPLSAFAGNAFLGHVFDGQEPKPRPEYVIGEPNMNYLWRYKDHISAGFFKPNGGREGRYTAPVSMRAYEHIALANGPNSTAFKDSLYYGETHAIFRLDSQIEGLIAVPDNPHPIDPSRSYHNDRPLPSYKMFERYGVPYSPGDEKSRDFCALWQVAESEDMASEYVIVNRVAKVLGVKLTPARRAPLIEALKDLYNAGFLQKYIPESSASRGHVYYRVVITKERLVAL